MRYELLYEIAKPVIEAVGADNVLRSIVESTAKGTGSKGCSILTLSADGLTLEHLVSYGLSDTYLSKGEIAVDESIEELLSGTPVNIINVANDPRIQYPEQALREGIASLLSIPIRGTSGDILGLLRIYTTKVTKFKKGEMDFLVSIADLGGIVLEKAKAYDTLMRHVDDAKCEIEKLEDDREEFVQFLSMVAHDLKAPVGAVESYLKVMLRGTPGPLTEKQETWLRRSIVRLDGMLELISDLLDVGRLETGQVAPEMQMTALGEVMDDCVETADGLAHQKQIRIVAEVAGDLPVVYASGKRLAQVINNLVSNAVRYTPEKGTIAIRAGLDGDYLRVDVEDDGSGIGPEVMPRIFDDFFRGDHDADGTGLGLSICKRVVELHGGRIWAESPAPGSDRGTRFSFTVRLRRTGAME
ncbi:MAG: GAF domain-containing sensor histidine kinase [Actinobacteria bacterium]|nr:GAF domain-containing sensor histidine kinase [Actinomycetota bacterium]MBU1944981.1 GAF domain-containing sensor histidine kinase [Actinomycetota bacterium]MBU2688462.1 GAF domain-containing sensor histidine kinase [Actinomycetota bacterium]